MFKKGGRCCLLGSARYLSLSLVPWRDDHPIADIFLAIVDSPIDLLFVAFARVPVLFSSHSDSGITYQRYPCLYRLLLRWQWS